jgi:hypothetical protein
VPARLGRRGHRPGPLSDDEVLVAYRLVGDGETRAFRSFGRTVRRYPARATRLRRSPPGFPAAACTASAISCMSSASTALNAFSISGPQRRPAPHGEISLDVAQSGRRRSCPKRFASSSPAQQMNSKSSSDSGAAVSRTARNWSSRGRRVGTSSLRSVRQATRGRDADAPGVKECAQRSLVLGYQFASG